MILDTGFMKIQIPVADSVRTFKLWDYLGTDKVPKIPYYMKSPMNQDPVNQPSRYNDITIIGNGNLGTTDNFKVSEQNGGRIMSESVPSFHVWDTKRHHL